MQASELDLERRGVGEAAEIDLVSREELIAGQFALRRLPADFAAETEVARLERHAADDDRPGGGAAANERIAEQAAVTEVDELARLTVLPRKDPDARADIRLNGRRVAERQQSDHRRKGYDAHPQLL